MVVPFGRFLRNCIISPNSYGAAWNNRGQIAEKRGSGKRAEVRERCCEIVGVVVIGRRFDEEVNMATWCVLYLPTTTTTMLMLMLMAVVCLCRDSTDERWRCLRRLTTKRITTWPNSCTEEVGVMIEDGNQRGNIEH